METVFIDGSAGEGGGQILRTSLALACITGKRLRVENIRAARRNPGLAKQHLSAVRAACEICNAKCRGAALGSGMLDFEPGPVQSGDFEFDIGSAGSASLVIQTLLPALFLAHRPSTITVTGGTHNPWAPPFDFLADTFVPAIEKAGFNGSCILLKHGFYPAGGGKICFELQPRQKSERKIDLCESCGEYQTHARIYLARLPEHIAQRQRKLLLRSSLDIQDVRLIQVTDSDGPGNCVMIRLCGGGRTTVFSAFGMRRKPSREVVGEVVSLAENFLSSGSAVDRFLADQLLIYMALSQGGSFTTNELSSHLTTNIDVIKKFLPVNFNVQQAEKVYRVSCKTC